MDLHTATTQWSEWQAQVTDQGNYGLELAGAQAASTEERSRLRAETMDFWKSEPEQQLKNISDLVKLYQSSINSLSRRAKTAETQFLQLYHVALRAPDPRQLVETISEELEKGRQDLAEETSEKTKLEQRLVDMSEQLYSEQASSKRLQQRLVELDEEFSTLKNQEVTVRRLEETLSEQQEESQRLVAEEVAERDQLWQATLQEIRESHEKEKDSMRHHGELAERERRLAVTRLQQIESTQLETQREAEEKFMAQASRIELLSAELERLSESTAAATAASTAGGLGARANPLGSSVHGDSSADPTTGTNNARLLQSKVHKLEEELRGARDALRDSRSAREDLEASKVVAMGEVTEKMEDLVIKLKATELEVASRPTRHEMEELRLKLRNSETVEHCEVEGARTDLETRLLQRQQQLEGLCASFRVALEEKEIKVADLEKTKASLQERVDDLNSLAEQLQREQQGQAQGISFAAPPLSIPTAHGDGKGRQVHETMGSVRATEMSLAGGASGLEPVAGGDPQAGGGKALVPSFSSIAWQQRERLRKKLLEVEQQRDEWKEQAAKEQRKAQRLHSDNVALVERIRYLQSYGGSKNVYRGAGAAGQDTELTVIGGGRGGSTPDGGRRNWGETDSRIDPSGSAVLLAGETAAGNELIQRYSDAYDLQVTRELADVVETGMSRGMRGGGAGGGVGSLDPFSHFRASEKMRRLKNLSFPERLLIGWANSMMATRATRTIASAYLSLMHILVGLCLLRLSSRQCSPP